MYKEIENNIYKVVVYCGGVHFVEAKTKDDIFRYVAEQCIKGSIVTCVNLISPDGKTPKIAVFTDKRYKEIYKEISQKK